MAIAAAADFAAFYDHTAAVMSDTGTLLVLSVDGKGIVMRPSDLREATRKKAEPDSAAGRLGDAGHSGRKRMATIGAVYDAETAPRRPHDIITLTKAAKEKHKKKAKTKYGKKRPGPKADHKWLTASVAADAADVGSPPARPKTWWAASRGCGRSVRAWASVLVCDLAAVGQRAGNAEAAI
jgi:hypothetical protein